MELRVQGGATPTPFLRARDTFTTEFELEHPVKVHVRSDPDQRTRVVHRSDHHELVMSVAAATSGMARELALHEFAHMRRYEQGHVSHHQSTEEAIYLAAGGRMVEPEQVAHCFQIANHMKDIYADDLTVRVGTGDKLVSFFESSLASAIIDGSSSDPSWANWTPAKSADPEIDAINAAFATALVERHELADRGHRLFDLAEILAGDATQISYDGYRRQFRSLRADPDAGDYRRALVSAFGQYLGETKAAD